MELIPPFLFPTFFVAALVLDRVVAARPQPRVRGWLAKGIGFYLLTSFLRLSIPPAVAIAMIGLSPLDLSGLGIVGGAIAVLLVGGFFDYWVHRTMHRSDRLWRWSHQLHHSAERVDLAGFAVTHPIDTVVATVIGATVVALLGVSPAAAAVAGFSGYMMAMLTHLNIRTPHWLGYFVQRPESHTIHHQRGVHAYNYGLPIWDMAFGTFRNPREVAVQTGFWHGASSQMLAMLRGRDVSVPPAAAQPGVRAA